MDEPVSFCQRKAEELHKRRFERVNTSVKHILVKNHILLTELPASVSGKKDRGSIETLRHIYNS